MTVEPQNVRVAHRECIEKYKGTFNIEVGDYAKIRFGRDSPGEYMWVKVTDVNGDRVEGTLDNDPEILDHMKCGDMIVFYKGDVCDRIREYEYA
jgi:uncharacterized protein YegJ (DUF2314 family)